ncbi:MAG: substrate-binding domain-containing protein [Desulfobacterales bacterium]|jgi:tungstate transport system substrate-binding protein
MKTRRWLFGGFAVLLCFLFFSTSVLAGGDPCKAVYGSGKRFTVATGSPGELGLLEVLADRFNRRHGTEMCWIKAGSGKSLQLLKNRVADAVMVHAPAAEKKAVEEGWAIGRTLIGSNEFYIVGPKSDPAGIASASSAAEAYARIAESQRLFLSRGDNSGTHKKEMAIWKQAGVAPAGSWYIITKDFMMGTLKRANEVNGYFMTDSSTWVAGKKNLHNLAVLFRGDPFLVNTYHGLCQPPGATGAQPHAEAFIRFLGSEEGQSLLRRYGVDRYGEAMYNDAEYARQYDH